MSAYELQSLDDILTRIEQIRSRVLEFIETIEIEQDETVLQPAPRVADSETDESLVTEVKR